MADIFISYAREDRTHAEAIAGALKAQGWSVWWDRQIRAGGNINEVIGRELGHPSADRGCPSTTRFPFHESWIWRHGIATQVRLPSSGCAATSRR